MTEATGGRLYYCYMGAGKCGNIVQPDKEINNNYYYYYHHHHHNHFIFKASPAPHLDITG